MKKDVLKLVVSKGRAPSSSYMCRQQCLDRAGRTQFLAVLISIKLVLREECVLGFEGNASCSFVPVIELVMSKIDFRLWRLHSSTRISHGTRSGSNSIGNRLFQKHAITQLHTSLDGFHETQP